MGISERLREERLRLNLTQAALAEAAGTTKKTQINWEQGVSLPSADALAAYQAAGVDVLYVLTGTRSSPSHLAEVKTPPGVAVCGRDVEITPSGMALLLNLRAEHGGGADLLWGRALLEAAAGYVPTHPRPIRMQRMVLEAPTGPYELLALYLERSPPALPYFIWPEGKKLRDRYELDMGTHSLPIEVPDLAIGSMTPVLVLGADMLERINAGECVRWACASNAWAEPAPEAARTLAVHDKRSVGQNARDYRKAFVSR